MSPLRRTLVFLSNSFCLVRHCLFSLAHIQNVRPPQCQDPPSGTRASFVTQKALHITTLRERVMVKLLVQMHHFCLVLWVISIRPYLHARFSCRCNVLIRHTRRGMHCTILQRHVSWWDRLCGCFRRFVSFFRKPKLSAMTAVIFSEISSCSACLTFQTTVTVHGSVTKQKLLVFSACDVTDAATLEDLVDPECSACNERHLRPAECEYFG